MKTFFVSVGASLLGILAAYIIALLFTDIMNFPLVMDPVVLLGIVIGLLSVLISKLNQVLIKFR